MSPRALRAAVLGSPISHSKSPLLHSAAYRYLGLEADYTRIEVTEAQAAEFLRCAGPDFDGFSVTMPLKAAMVEQMTTVSDRVAVLGVLNTITVTRSGTGRVALSGENTDVEGITASMRQIAVAPTGPEPFAVLGAGGTAAAAVAAAADLGFSFVNVYARSPERAAAAVPLAHRFGLEAQIRTLDQLAGDLDQHRAGAVVSTLPARAADWLADELSAVADLPPLLDAAYDPWPSALARTWQSAGATVVSGVDMLLHQAVKQVELFTAATRSPAGQLSAAGRAEMVAAMRTAVQL